MYYSMSFCKNQVFSTIYFKIIVFFCRFLSCRLMAPEWFRPWCRGQNRGFQTHEWHIRGLDGDTKDWTSLHSRKNLPSWLKIHFLTRETAHTPRWAVPRRENNPYCAYPSPPFINPDTLSQEWCPWEPQWEHNREDPPSCSPLSKNHNLLAVLDDHESNLGSRADENSGDLSTHEKHPLFHQSFLSIACPGQTDPLKWDSLLLNVHRLKDGDREGRSGADESANRLDIQCDTSFFL